METETEKNQGRYNLRRRKDDVDAKADEVKPQQLEEKKAKLTAASAAAPSTRLDFGGKIGRFQLAVFKASSFISIDILKGWLITQVKQCELHCGITCLTKS